MDEEKKAEREQLPPQTGFGNEIHPVYESSSPFLLSDNASCLKEKILPLDGGTLING